MSDPADEAQPNANADEPQAAEAPAPESSHAPSSSSPEDNQAQAPGAEPEAPGDQPLALGDHLEELRRVLIKSLIALVLGIALCFALFGDHLFTVFVAPLEMESVVLNRAPRIPAATLDEHGRASHVLVTIDVLERFKALLFVAIVGGIFFAGPYILWQIWAFVRVGLYPRERRVFYVLLPASAVLFASGVCFGYFIMLPVVVDFMLNLGGEQFDQALRTELRLSNYLTYFVVMTLVVGMIFQIPVAMTIMARVTDVNPASLRKLRRYVIVGALAVGMIFTPPDPLTQIMLAIPVALLFELGLVCSDWAHNTRMREHEAIMAEPDPWQQMWDEQGSDLEDTDSEDDSGDGDGYGDGGGDGDGGGASDGSGAESGRGSSDGNGEQESGSRDLAGAAGMSSSTTTTPPPEPAHANDIASDYYASDTADAEQAADAEEEEESGPVARTSGFVTWRPSRSSTESNDNNDADDNAKASGGDTSEDATASTTTSQDEASNQPSTSPFARTQPPTQAEEPTKEPPPTPPKSPPAPPRPHTEGEILELIDMRLEHYIRDELTPMIRNWINEELRKHQDPDNDDDNTSDNTET